MHTWGTAVPDGVWGFDRYGYASTHLALLQGLSRQQYPAREDRLAGAARPGSSEIALLFSHLPLTT